MVSAFLFFDNSLLFLSDYTETVRQKRSLRDLLSIFAHKPIS